MLELLTTLGKKVYSLTTEEVNDRIKEISAIIKNLDKLGLKASKELQMEAMLLTTRIMMDNDMDGSMDGDTCEDGHCEC